VLAAEVLEIRHVAEFQANPQARWMHFEEVLLVSKIVDKNEA
jgi:hypothetical protein